MSMGKEKTKRYLGNIHIWGKEKKKRNRKGAAGERQRNQDGTESQDSQLLQRVRTLRQGPAHGVYNLEKRFREGAGGQSRQC